eukprot:TRINITY_DN30235_c0_g1_i3.p1 TRINITY_DN30235_c0_g1~~TRINITY_DN30235_c0_g1_i3.p1  ORF type:complete len:139 (-),score=0.60 TRINITY_DN30235_c0_g1_i3:58-474(-)
MLKGRVGIHYMRLVGPMMLTTHFTMAHLCIVQDQLRDMAYVQRTTVAYRQLHYLRGNDGVVIEFHVGSTSLHWQYALSIGRCDIHDMECVVLHSDYYHLGDDMYLEYETLNRYDSHNMRKEQKKKKKKKKKKIERAHV